MADLFDQASDLEALDLASSLIRQKLKAAKAKKVEATGCCLYCGEAVPEGHRWCDAECRDEWQKDNPGQ